MDPDKLPKSEKVPTIRWGVVDSVDIFHVKENELDILEKGAPVELDLNFAIALFSFAFSSFTSLLTSTFHTQTWQTVFIVISFGGATLGAYFAFRYWRGRTDINKVIRTIRNRLPAKIEPPSQPSAQPTSLQADPNAPKG